MISHEYKCIFIHIPKCAGTSIERALGHHGSFLERGVQDHRTLRQIKPKNSSNLVFYSNKLRYQRKKILSKFGYKPNRNINNYHTVSYFQYEAYFKFSFVRNPWDRCYSWYRNVVRDPVLRDKFNTARKSNFHDFLIENIGKNSLRSQLFWIENSKEKIELDFIGRFEQLENDFTHVCNVIGANVSLPHILSGGRNEYRKAYSPELKDLVSEVFEREIALFGYTFDN